MNLDAAFNHCEKIIQTNSRSFYLAFKDLPKPKREALYAVYAFCRKGDDLIDLHNDPQALMAMRTQLLNLDALQSVDPLWVAIKEAIHRYEIPLQPFLDQFEGQRQDAQFTHLDTFEALLNYSYLVASTVGQMLLPILATHKHRQLNPFAIRLGQAMQITNILRDVGEDAERGRIYIPQSWLNDAARNAIHTKTVNPDFIDVWERLAQQAENLYAQCLPEIQHFDDDAQKPLVQAIFFYRGILDAVRKADYNCLTQRPYVDNFEGLKQQIELFLKHGVLA
jgi:phytoene synthase